MFIFYPNHLCQAIKNGGEGTKKIPQVAQIYGTKNSNLERQGLKINYEQYLRELIMHLSLINNNNDIHSHFATILYEI